MLGLRRGTVQLVSHEEVWEQAAQETIAELQILCPGAVEIQHVGSTAIRGIHAKPILDLAVAVRSLTDAEGWQSVLETNGYRFCGADQPDQLLFTKGEGEERTHHIHVVLWDGPAWNNYLNFRDYLNTHPEKAAAYDALKLTLAAKYATDRKTYTAQKAMLIEELLEEARRWRTDRKKLLVTGGTVFVSRYVAEYFRDKGYDVYVLNRNSRPQSEGVTLIEGDRRCLGDVLKRRRFDAVLDMTAYYGEDVDALLDALGDFGTYILLSSSAVYPETAQQPFTEETPVGPNCHWGAYGTGKIAAEQALARRVPDAYILRPPYLYGPGNNVYREAFVFDCAMAEREFYLPRDGEMKLQFFHVRDLCRVMEMILEKQPSERVFNVGNRETVAIRDWATLCYRVASKETEFVSVHRKLDQRNYFSFYDYEYELDVEKQNAVLEETVDLEDGLKEAFAWYRDHMNEVRKKPYLQFIDERLT